MARKRKLGRGINAKGRSIGEGQYAPLPYAMLQSPAWRSLSGAAVKVYLEVRCRFHGANNGNLSLSLDQAADLLGLGKATVHCAFKELQDKGFVVCTRRGQWYGRLASLWAVTDKGIGESLPTNAWRRWQPGVSVLRPTIKTENGSNTDPSGHSYGRIQNRKHFNGSDAEPVRANGGVAIGSITDR
jgi:biotin operon repressor